MCTSGAPVFVTHRMVVIINLMLLSWLTPKCLLGLINVPKMLVKSFLILEKKTVLKLKKASLFGEALKTVNQYSWKTNKMKDDYNLWYHSQSWKLAMKPFWPITCTPRNHFNHSFVHRSSQRSMSDFHLFVLLYNRAGDRFYDILISRINQNLVAYLYLQTAYRWLAVRLVSMTQSLVSIGSNSVEGIERRNLL